jgi:hypothetical protein
MEKLTSLFLSTTCFSENLLIYFGISAAICRNCFFCFVSTEYKRWGKERNERTNERGQRGNLKLKKKHKDWEQWNWKGLKKYDLLTYFTIHCNNVKKQNGG